MLKDQNLFILKDVRRVYPGEAPICFPGEIFIPRGEFIGILGRSGTGKTTLLNLLALLDEADEGSITYQPFKGDAVHYPSLSGKTDQAALLRAQRFGYIFQNDELLDQFSVEQNIQMPLWMLRKELTRVELEEHLKQVDLHELEGCLDRNPADLSVGQRSRIALLRALSGSPEIIFADEPTANVDEKAQKEILDLLVRWHRDERHPGRTILLSTHNLEMASEYCNHFLILNSRSSISGNPGVVQYDGKLSPERLRTLVLGNEKRAVDYTRREGGALLSHPKTRALWKLLRYDFLGYPRSKWSFLVSGLTPTMFVLALLVLLCFGSYILGIREGSAARYSRAWQNDLLWNTEVFATAEQIDQFVTATQSENLLRHRTGFFHLPILAFRKEATDFTNPRNLVQFVGRTMEKDDPLLNSVGETLVWPEQPEARRNAVERFRQSEFGIIISMDALDERLGYSSISPPDMIVVHFDRFTRFWIPVFAVAREVPNGDFIVSPDIYAAYMKPGFVDDYLRSDVFYLGIERGVDDAEVVRRTETWLGKMGLRYRSVTTRTVKGDRVIKVGLRERMDEFELQSKMRERWAEVDRHLQDVRFPKSFPPARSKAYNRWSLILQRSTAAVSRLIRSCHSHDIFIDTSVRARVESLEHSYEIFRVLSEVIFWTILVMGAVLLITMAWFNSSKAIHSVGVMLGLGVSRRLVILAYTAQLLLLVGILLLAYVCMDFAGVFAWITAGINRAFFYGVDIVEYRGWSTLWFVYASVSLLAIPALIAGLRYYLYRHQPAYLLNVRN